MTAANWISTINIFMMFFITIYELATTQLTSKVRFVVALEELNSRHYSNEVKCYPLWNNKVNNFVTN